MARHTQYFTVRREVDGENTELELQAECEVNDENAHIAGQIYVRDDDGELQVWSGSLTEEEEEEIAHDARDAWFEISGEDIEDEELLDSEYDSFGDQGITVGGGRLY
jgi:hypothetical protein